MLQLAKKELELDQVAVGRKALEYRILECNEEIERLKEHIKVQITAEERLKQEIKTMKEGK